MRTPGSGPHGAVVAGEEGAAAVGRHGAVVVGNRYESCEGWRVAAGVGAAIAVGTMLARPPTAAVTVSVGGSSFCTRTVPTTRASCPAVPSFIRSCLRRSASSFRRCRSAAPRCVLAVSHTASAGRRTTSASVVDTASSCSTDATAMAAPGAAARDLRDAGRPRANECAYAVEGRRLRDVLNARSRSVSPRDRDG